MNCLLNGVEIQELLDRGVILNANPANINAASIDITLGNTILTEVQPYRQAQVSLKKRDPLYTNLLDISKTGYILQSGEFILAQSAEIFCLPNNISAEYKLKSSMARVGLDHLNAGWCDAGWTGSVLTLELKNLTRFHNIRLEPGDKIGQMIFFKHNEVPTSLSYASKGSYNQDTQVTPTKKERKEASE